MKTTRPICHLACFMTFLVAATTVLSDEPIKFAIAIHGGSGSAPNTATDDAAAGRRRALENALGLGVKVLKNGGTSLDVVEQVIVLLEDDALFNSGKGAVFNHVGRHELDASIMDGRDLSAGAVAGVSIVKNPIRLSRLVMTETRHILFAGAGAEQFARDMKVELVPNSYFDTDRARASWQKALRRQKQSRASAQPTQRHFGTVGCVVLDQHGNLAAGTSTGGLTDKEFGRVGDSPVIGAGTYANNKTCAVSCTGTGERFIERSIAFDVSARMAYKDLNVKQSVGEIFSQSLPDRVGGLIAVSHTGQIAIQFNTAGMARAQADSNGLFEVIVGK
ncbi:MAG: isoaspartyl peptidase/L-asparaginase [Pirellulaceae bacterium]